MNTTLTPIERELLTKKDVLWPRIHAERKALAADLAKLTPAQWAAQSLCEKWTVQQVVGHLISTTHSSPAEFAKGLVKHKLSFSAMAESAADAFSTGQPEHTLARYEAAVPTETAPPGPIESWLGETIVHGEDIRRPLGIKRSYSTDDLMTIANFYKNSNLIIGAKDRIKGFHLVATDEAWSAGSGQEVKGPLLSLIMTMVGRTAYLDDLSGDGAEAFKARLLSA